MKKNKDNNKDGNLDNKRKNSPPENSTDNLDDSLNEIKKLADDFLMSEEPINEPTSSKENETLDNSDDILNRLGDIASDSTESIKKDEQFDFDQRLSSISKAETENQKQKKSKEVKKSKSQVDKSEEVRTRESKEDKTKKVEDISQEPKVPSTSKESNPEEISLKDESNEEFLDQMKSSLESDPDYKNIHKKSTKDPDSFKTYEEGADAFDIIEDLEQEITNAETAVNPFIPQDEKAGKDEFLSNLENIPVDDLNTDKMSEDKAKQSAIPEEDPNISSESWDDLLESTENEEDGLDFENEDSFEDFLKKIDDVIIEEEDEIQPNSLPERTGDELESDTDNSQDSISLDDEEEDQSLEGEKESEKSVDNLRKSFIDEFDQSAWEAELSKRNKKKWFARVTENLRNWFGGLNLAEKILIILSFLISLAVIVAIGLVVTQWRANSKKIANPPPAIEVADEDLIYPTGLELPGGWFFFLQRGEIEDNRWEPVNAEWLANTRLRRVVAIPWSNQSETVIQSLTKEHEISLFMNNNDVVTYQVEEILQISRENVRILSDTEPSLAIILFREDDEDRWAVIARPK